MRSIDDSAGVTWDVAVGKESYGSMVLLFSRRGSREMRRVSIEANSRLEAERMLSAYDAQALRSKLDAAAPVSELSPANRRGDCHGR